jgi:nicotinamidase/pyrazinamidase
MPGATLLVIDPQNDFVAADGALSVPGASADMDRLAAMIEREPERIEAIWVSLDQHQVLDIAHPRWWADEAGATPAPFTAIRAADVESGRWRTRDPSAQARTLAYLRTLEASGRYPHVVWPEHCLIGDPGAAVWPALSRAIHGWERRRHRSARFVLKGTNPWTEHFSAVRAEVVDPDDASTEVSQPLVAAMAGAGRVLVAGEARSHCVANTVRDLCDAVPDPGFPERVVLLTDACSDVAGFEALGAGFVRELTARGMRTASTADALASPLAASLSPDGGERGPSEPTPVPD